MKSSGFQSFRLRGLAGKLAGFFGGFIVLALAMVAWQGYSSAKEIIEQEILEAKVGYIESMASNIDTWLQGKQWEVQALAESPLAKNGMEYEQVDQLTGNQIKYLNATQDLYEAVFSARLSNQQFRSAVIDGNSVIFKEGDASTRPYMTAGKEGKGIIMDPVISKTTGAPVVIITAAVKDSQGKPLGVLGENLRLTYIDELISGLSFAGKGYGFLLDSQGTIISHPDETLKMKTKITEIPGLEEAGQEMLQGKSGLISYRFKGEERVTVYAPIKSTNWVAAITVPYSDLYAPLIALRNKTLIVIAVILAIVLVVMPILVKKVVDPIKNVQKSIEDIAQGEGDLTKQLEVQTNDEIGQLADSFNKLIASLKDMIGQIKGNVEVVNRAAGILTNNSEEAATSTISVANSIQGLASSTTEQTNAVANVAEIIAQLAESADSIAKGATEQAQSMTGAHSSLQMMIKMINNASSKIEEIKAGSSQNMAIAQDGGEKISGTIKEMNLVKDVVLELANKMNDLDSHSEQIGNIVEVISEIAEQTNLLALNAAIEAARAGEHGKGFAVVADEVRKLAERSGLATKEISGLIKEIQRVTQETMVSMEAGTKTVQKGVVIAEEARDALKEILKVINDSNGATDEINEAIVSISQSSRGVSSASETVAAITEENSAAIEEIASSIVEIKSILDRVLSGASNNSATAQEVAACTEEITASIQEMSSSAQSLEASASSLDQMVNKFKI